MSAGDCVRQFPQQAGHHLLSLKQVSGIRQGCSIEDSPKVRDVACDQTCRLRIMVDWSDLRHARSTSQRPQGEERHHTYRGSQPVTRD